MEAEQQLFDCSKDNGNIILVAEAVTRVAQAKSEMMQVVTEAEEDAFQLIQMQNSITNGKNTESVK